MMPEQRKSGKNSKFMTEFLLRNNIQCRSFSTLSNSKRARSLSQIHGLNYLKVSSLKKNLSRRYETLPPNTGAYRKGRSGSYISGLCRHKLGSFEKVIIVSCREFKWLSSDFNHFSIFSQLFLL